MSCTLNFGDIPEKYSNRESSKIVILPVPYDMTSTWLKGADKGPDAIIQASANMELYDIETDSEVYLKGIFTEEATEEQTTPEKMAESVASKVGGYLDEDKFVVVLGGEHSVSIGPVAAHHCRHPGFGVLQLDAHADLRQEYLGSKYNHACVMARIAQMCPAVQVGIRSMSSEELENANMANIFFAEKIHDSDGWIQDVLSRLPERVYITIDLDVFDPAVMPSTGTPEPGGMNWYDVLKLLRTVADNRNIIGFDVVELCPDEHNRAPDFLAAKLIYKLLSYKFRG